MPFDLDDVQRIAASEVHSFVQRAPWSSGHVADMQQEVIITLMTAQETFDASKGTWRGYAAGAARNAIVRYLKRAQLWRRRGMTMEPLTQDHDGIVDPDPTPDELFDDTRTAKKVRRILRSLDFSPHKVGLAAALGAPSREVARRARVPVEEVYYARAQMVRRAALSIPLKQLWKELRP